MANFEIIKTTIDANINTNGNQAITGAVMNSVLKQMVDSTDTELAKLSGVKGKESIADSTTYSQGIVCPAGKAKVSVSIVNGENRGVWSAYRYKNGAFYEEILIASTKFNKSVEIDIPQGDDGVWLFVNKEHSAIDIEYTIEVGLTLRMSEAETKLSEAETQIGVVQADLSEISKDTQAVLSVVTGQLGKEVKTSTRRTLSVWLDDTPNEPSYKVKISCANPPVEAFSIYKATLSHGDLERIILTASFDEIIEIERDNEKPVLYLYNTSASGAVASETYTAEYFSVNGGIQEQINALSNPIELYGYYKNAPKLYNKPLVCFVFDVPIYKMGEALLKEFMDYCDELNIKVSIATSTNASFAKILQSNGWLDRMQNGHDIISYPLDDDVMNNVGSVGFGSCDEASVMARYAKNKAAFDAMGIKMDVGIWHNSSVKVPSAVSQVRELYKTIIGGLGGRYTQEMCEDLSCWNRNKIEGSTFDALKTFFDKALGQQKVVVFGTHLVTSDGVMLQYENYTNEIKPFLRYLSDLANAGFIASVSITHALESVQNERAIRNYIPFKRYEFTAPLGEIYRTQDTVNRVTNGGNPYIFKLDIVGTASGGAIGISIDGDSGSESKNISVPSGASAEDVAALFYTHAFFSNYRTKVIGSSVYFYRCRTDNVDVSFEITSNTSGVTITKTDIINAVAHSVTTL